MPEDRRSPLGGVMPEAKQSSAQPQRLWAWLSNKPCTFGLPGPTLHVAEFSEGPDTYQVIFAGDPENLVSRFFWPVDAHGKGCPPKGDKGRDILHTVYEVTLDYIEKFHPEGIAFTPTALRLAEAHKRKLVALTDRLTAVGYSLIETDNGSFTLSTKNAYGAKQIPDDESSESPAFGPR